MDELSIKVEHVSKEYRLGAIGGGTLRGDLQSWMARIQGKEDPNTRIGSTIKNRIGERFLALDDVSFEVRKGEALGIIGHNGAGKSTLLKLLSRVTAPTKGKLSYNGRIASMLEVGTGFHRELTGRENVYMNGAILGMTKLEISRKFDEIVQFAEMEQFIDTPSRMEALSSAPLSSITSENLRKCAAALSPTAMTPSWMTSGTKSTPVTSSGETEAWKTGTGGTLGRFCPSHFFNGTGQSEQSPVPNLSTMSWSGKGDRKPCIRLI